MKAFGTAVIVLGILLMYNASGRSIIQDQVTGIAMVGIGIWLIERKVA